MTLFGFRTHLLMSSLVRKSLLWLSTVSVLCWGSNLSLLRLFRCISVVWSENQDLSGIPSPFTSLRHCSVRTTLRDLRIDVLYNIGSICKVNCLPWRTCHPSPSLIWTCLGFIIYRVSRWRRFALAFMGRGFQEVERNLPASGRTENRPSLLRTEGTS